jgi:hypothetical protein
MVCSNCNGICTNKHNKRTCPHLSDTATNSEKRVAKELNNLLDYTHTAEIKHKRAHKSLEGLAGCQNIFKEPKAFYTSKKTRKTLEGLADCQNIFKEPKAFYIPKKTRKPLEGLANCQNIFKEPKSIRSPKRNTKCSGCGQKGHNKRTCSITCQPCVDQTARAICFAGLTADKATALAQTLHTSHFD